MRYSNNSWSIQERKDELKTEINSARPCKKKRGYARGPGCVSTPSSDPVSPLVYTTRRTINPITHPSLV